jgi:hypothetical protein
LLKVALKHNKSINKINQSIFLWWTGLHNRRLWYGITTPPFLSSPGPKGHVSFCHHFASSSSSSSSSMSVNFSYSSLKPLKRFGPILAEMFIGRSSTRFFILVKIRNPTWLPGTIMCSDWLKRWKSSCQKLLSRWNCNIIEMMTGWSSTKFVIFVPIAYPRWPPQGNNSLPLDPMEISFKDLFLRNYLTNWIFCIMWMVLEWFYTWSIILVQIGNPTWLPWPIMCSNWLKLWRSSCQKLLSPWNCYIIEMMTGWSSAKFFCFFCRSHIQDGRHRAT